MNPAWKLFLGESFLIEYKSGTRATHAIQLKSDFGNDKVSRTPLVKAKNSLWMVFDFSNVFENIKDY